jgi:hypothetical protein
MEQFYPKASYNFDKLLEEIRASYPLANLASGNGIDNTSGIRVQMPDGTNQATMDAIGAIVTAHNANTLTTAQQEATQAESARNALKALMNGLHGLSASDKGYALYCRLLASRDGASNATINGIVDRPTAVAYVTSKPEWTAATAATRNLIADILEADAALCMVLLLVL